MGDERADRTMLLDAVPAMVGYWDRDVRNRFANRAYVEWFGMTPERMDGLPMRDVLGDEPFAKNEPYVRAVLGGEPQSFEREIVDASGVRRDPLARYLPDVRDGLVVGFVVLVMDISAQKTAERELKRAYDELETRVIERTAELVRANETIRAEMLDRARTEAELLRAEAQLHQAQRLESLGRLSGVVAHDFNNVLSIVLGCSDHLLEVVAVTDEVRVEVEQIRAAAVRAGELTSQLLAFSRQRMVDPRDVDVNEVLGGLRRVLPRLLGEDVRVVWRDARPEGFVCVDPGRLEQVLMNLVVNARDAMPGGGEVTIETRDVVVAADGATAAPPPGEWVMIAIRDTGTGMTAETRAHIFDPFFTTKELGRGTGLGLATVAAIVSQAGGHVLVDTLVGSGSTFSVYLPRVTRPRPVASPEPTRAAGGTETVLLVEDDHRVRAVALRVLVRSGYVVLEAGSGEEALTRVADAGRIDLLLTDVVMPGMRGTRLATELRALRPTLKVLFMSGYADDDLFAGDRVGARPPLVTKPFTPSSLLAAIRSVLDAPLSM